jgi:predicted Zn-dependent peptidase
MPSGSMQNQPRILAESPHFPMRIKYLLTLLVAGGLASAAIANPYETTLKNGLRVIVKEDRRAPTAVQMVWYRIGSMDEVDGASGVAHVLEHMMFKGTPSVGPANSTSVSPPPAARTTPLPAATTPPTSSRSRRKSWPT